MKTNFLGTMNMLGLAKRVKARFLLSSTSGKLGLSSYCQKVMVMTEVYGSPEEHPQEETYWGHVNPIGQHSIPPSIQSLTYTIQAQEHATMKANV